MSLYHVIDEYKLTMPGNTLVPLTLSIGDLRQGDVFSLAMKSSRDNATFVIDLLPSAAYVLLAAQVLSGRH